MPWNDPNHYKDAARIAVKNAVRSGRLLKPKSCTWCGDTGLMHGHHDSYDKPLNVLWLCPSCHTERHNYINDYGIENVLAVEDAYTIAVFASKGLV